MGTTATSEAPPPLQPPTGRDTHRRHHKQCGSSLLWHGDSFSINAASPFCLARDTIPFAVLNVLYAVSLFLFGGMRWVVTAATPALLRALCHLVFYVAGTAQLHCFPTLSTLLRTPSNSVPTTYVVYVYKLEAKPQRSGERREFTYAVDATGAPKKFACFAGDTRVADVNVTKKVVELRRGRRSNTQQSAPEIKTTFLLNSDERARILSVWPTAD